jgi:AcrR family transcriptional regulator
MGANPKTTVFLKECLADALIRLLETKPTEKITIPEIAALAGVGRTTYFRNFSSKEDMLSFKLILLWERWAEEHGVEVKRRYSADNALTFFQFNHSIRALLTLMYSRDLQSALYKAFHIYMMPSDGADPLECYQSSFYSYGLFGLLDAWIVRGFCETPEEMAEIGKAI